jgi:tetratricopeptide (TPR) repeat protein
MKHFVLLLAISLIPLSVYSQTEAEKKEARQLAMKAIEVMDNGQIDQSIEMLIQCTHLDPESFAYPYEIGYAYYMKEDYPKAIGIFEDLVRRKESDAQCYQMLGNAYDLNNQSDKALKTYKRGLERFPKSGRLFLELGNIERSQNHMDAAITYYENGIKADPAFPSNYYWAARIFCDSEDEIWGLIYGEIFMNLERGSERTAEISKILYDTYVAGIRFDSDTAFTISFCKNNIILSAENDKIPFPMIYESSMALAVISEDTVNMGTLNRIRERFVGFYYEKRFSETYYNALFEWHKTLIQKNQFQSYNYWLFMQGSYPEFSEWMLKNKQAFDGFLSWFSNNPVKINEKNYFVRTGL